MEIELVLGVVIGAIFGFCLSLLFKKGSDQSLKIKELEAEHEKYRKQVDDHFVNTAVLFKGLTDQYRDVYRHIASGAGELCSEEAKALHIDLEESALLNKPDEDVAEEPETVDLETASLKDSPMADLIQEADSTAEGQADDDFPLATEVEISADIAEEIKSQNSKEES